MQTDYTSNTPFFSIVIPTYNREDLIFETLETVFNQSLQNFEIIVVDNASTDDSVLKLRKLESEGKIRLIVNEKNMERSFARNVGMKAANGKYLTLLDSDDFMYPNALMDSKNYLEANPAIHFFHHYYELVSAEERKTINQYKSPDQEKQIKKLAEGNFISCIGVFLSKEIYKNFAFNEDQLVIGSEDWELWIRVISTYPLGVIRKMNFGVRSHPQRSISAYEIETIVKRKKYIILNLLKLPEVSKIFKQYEGLMYSSALIFAAVFANQAKEFNRAKELLREALKINPKLIFKRRFIRVAQIAQFKIEKYL
jgi:glycosyltransferase involved in cell wall biosynthesis